MSSQGYSQFTTQTADTVDRLCGAATAERVSADTIIERMAVDAASMELTAERWAGFRASIEPLLKAADDLDARTRAITGKGHDVSNSLLNHLVSQFHKDCEQEAYARAAAKQEAAA